MSNKRPAEKQLRPVYEPSVELVAYCRCETRATVDAHGADERPGWFTSPAVLRYVRRNGTPLAYQALTNPLYLRFVRGHFSWQELVSLLRQGAYVPTMCEFKSLFEAAHNVRYDMEGEEEDGDDPTPEQARYTRELRQDVRNVLPAVAEVVEDKFGLPWNGGAQVLGMQCPLFSFIRCVHAILSDSDADAEALRPIFWNALETLMNRGFDFEEADINGDTPRSFLEQWDNTQATRLFEPVILK